MLHNRKGLLYLSKRNHNTMSKHKIYTSVTETEVDSSSQEPCFACGCNGELDVHGRCYDCGLEDAQEFTKEND